MKLKLGQPMLPRFAVPEGLTPADYFRKVARDGLDRRFAGNDAGEAAIAITAERLTRAGVTFRFVAA